MIIQVVRTMSLSLGARSRSNYNDNNLPPHCNCCGCCRWQPRLWSISTETELVKTGNRKAHKRRGFGLVYIIIAVRWKSCNEPHGTRRRHNNSNTHPSSFGKWPLYKYGGDERHSHIKHDIYYISIVL